MTIINQIHKCNICGNIVEMVHAGKGALVCCGENMELKREQSQGEYAEKHSPVIEQDGNKIKVQIGKVLHPMEDEHYIEWIEIITDNKTYRKNLQPGGQPIAEFQLKEDEKINTARMYCNIHGLWITNQ